MAGLINLFILLLISAGATLRFVSRIATNDLYTAEFLKKLSLHLLLCGSVATDIPMYIGFIVYGDYVNGLYGFHKMQSCMLFAAFSVVIKDWARVLYEIKELGKMPFFFRNGTLLILNLGYIAIGIVSLFYLWLSPDIDDFVDSPFYYATVFIQVGVSLCLTCLMLQTGLKLASKINGAVSFVYTTNGAQDEIRSSLPYDRESLFRYF